MKGDLQSYKMSPKCLVMVTFTNLKGPLSKAFKIHHKFGFYCQTCFHDYLQRINVIFGCLDLDNYFISHSPWAIGLIRVMCLKFYTSKQSRARRLTTSIIFWLLTKQHFYRFALIEWENNIDV